MSRTISIPTSFELHPIEESKQLRIEQVRELAEELALTSHQGGYKVGHPLAGGLAQSLRGQRAAEDAGGAAAAHAAHPGREPALAPAGHDSEPLPALTRARPDARGEPRMAAGHARGRAIGTLCWTCWAKRRSWPPRLTRKRSRAWAAKPAALWRSSPAGAADPVATAERWSRSEPALRLRCFENWLTDRIRDMSRRALPYEIRPAAHLPRGAAPLNIRGLFELADGVRDLRSALDVPINRSLALEGLLRRLQRGPIRESDGFHCERVPTSRDC